MNPPFPPPSPLTPLLQTPHLLPSCTLLGSFLLNTTPPSSPAYPALLISLAAAHTQSSSPAAALPLLHQAQSHPATPPSHQPHLSYLIASALATLNQPTQAIAQLYSCPRSASGSLLLFQLLRTSSLAPATSAALAAELHNVLELEPQAVQAAMLLLELPSAPLPPTSPSTAFLAPLYQAHQLAATFHLQPALGRFRALLADPAFRNTSHVLSNIAKLELQLGNREGALACFARAQAVAPHDIASADVHASCLRGQSRALTALTHALLPYLATKPQPWVCLALLQETRGDARSALAFASRALEVDPTHLPALHYAGALHLTLGDTQASLQHYARAYALRRDFNAFKGLIFALLYHSPPKTTDALHFAKEALELMPHDARSSVLVGRVFACTVAHEDKAVKAFTRALRLDPDSLEAACCVADVALAQLARGGDASLALEACALLEQVTRKPCPKDSVLVKLGSLYLALNRFEDALASLHHALAISPNLPEAKEAMDRLQEALSKRAPPAPPTPQQVPQPPRVRMYTPASPMVVVRSGR